MDQQSTINNRIYFLRAYAIVMVVLQHTLTYASGNVVSDFLAKIAAYSNAVIFMFVSGYVYELNRERYRQQKVGEFIRKKAKRILVPYLVWSYLMAFCCFVLSKFSFASALGDLTAYVSRNILEVTIDNLLFRNMIVEHLWYLYVLFAIFLILAIFRHRKIPTAVIVSSFFLSSLLEYLFADSLPSIVTHFLLSVPIFFLGMGACNINYLEHKPSKGIILEFLAWLLLFAEKGYLHLSVGIIRYFTYFGLIIMSIVVVTEISYYVTSRGKGLRYIKNLADYSFGIYLMHTPYIVLPVSVLLEMMGVPWLLMVIFAGALSIIIPAIACKLVVKRSRFLSILLIGEDTK